MPGSPLYPVKLATEQVQMALTFTSDGKAELYAELADRRVDEIAHAVNMGSAHHVEQTAERLDYCLGMIVTLTAPQMVMSDAAMAPTMEESTESVQVFEEAPLKPGEGDWRGPVGANRRRDELRVSLEHNAAHHSAELHALLETAPASVKPALLNAISISETGYQQALEAVSDEVY